MGHARTKSKKKNEWAENKTSRTQVKQHQNTPFSLCILSVRYQSSILVISQGGSYRFYTLFGQKLAVSYVYFFRNLAGSGNVTLSKTRIKAKNNSGSNRRRCVTNCVYVSPRMCVYTYIPQLAFQTFVLKI